MHTMVTVRCRPNDEWERAGKNIDHRRRRRVDHDVLGWTCAHVMLQDGPAAAAGMYDLTTAVAPGTDDAQQPVTL